MAGHASNVPVKLKASRIRAVPTLQTRLGDADPDFDIDDADTYPEAWGCGNSCDAVKIFGVTFMVDFSARTIIEDPDSKPCSRKERSGGDHRASTDTSIKSIRHPKVDVNTIFPLFRLPSDFSRLPLAGIYDETLMASLSADKAIALQSPEKVPPQSFLNYLRTLAVQVGAVLAANSAALASTLVAKRTSRVDTAKGRYGLIHEGASGAAEFTLDIPNKNNLTFIGIQRGLLEIAEYTVLMHRTHFQGCSYNDFVAATFDLYRADIAEVVEVVSDATALTKDVAAALDSNTFYVLGARLLANQKASLQAFFRRERPRYDSAAKKAGWKPPAPKAAAARANPVTGKRRTRDDSKDDTDHPDDNPPRTKDVRNTRDQHNPRRRRPRKGGAKGKGNGRPADKPSASATFAKSEPTDE